MPRSRPLAIVALVLALAALAPAASLAQDVAGAQPGGAAGNDMTAQPPEGTGGTTPTGDGATRDTGAGPDTATGTGAGTDTGTDAAATAPAPAETMSHRYQVGLRAGIGIPFMFGLKYKGDNPPCDVAATHQTWCRHFGVGTLDFDLGFGVSDAIELSFDARFGLADEPSWGAPPVSIGLGMRAYGSPEENIKLYFGPRLILDLTSSDLPNWTGVDFGVRGDMGLQFDFIRYVGMYVQLGLQLTFLRALMFVPDLSIGVQVRLP